MKRDNITLSLEIDKINQLIETLDKEHEKGVILKKEINLKVANSTQEDEIKYYEQNILNPLEKRLYDIKQISVVKKQSLLALEVIYKNNEEIIKNIEQIKNVTITAMDTALSLANSLKEQKSIMNNSKDMLKGTFSDVLRSLSKAEMQSQKSFPENDSKIIELKNYGDSV